MVEILPFLGLTLVTPRRWQRAKRGAFGGLVAPFFSCGKPKNGRSVQVTGRPDYSLDAAAAAPCYLLLRFRIPLLDLLHPAVAAPAQRKNFTPID